MRNLVKTLALSATLVLGLTIGAAAQTADNSATAKKGGHAALNLTDAQKAQMKANHESQKANEEKFKASLNADQKAIMADKALTPKERRKKLDATLTADQKAMFKSNMENAKKNREAIKATLTPEQKAKMEQMRAQRGKKGHHKPKA
jgi:Spy/CpxP family protein refolding chaperone